MKNNWPEETIPSYKITSRHREVDRLRFTHKQDYLQVITLNDHPAMVPSSMTLEDCAKLASIPYHAQRAISPIGVKEDKNGRS